MCPSAPILLSIRETDEEKKEDVGNVFVVVCGWMMVVQGRHAIRMIHDGRARWRRAGDSERSTGMQQLAELSFQCSGASRQASKR